MKRKNILKLISILIVICIIAIVSIVKIRNYIRETVIVDGMRTQKDIDDIQKQVENYVSDKIVPKGLSRLYGTYKGDNDLNDIYRSIYSFVNYLPTISKKVKYDNEDAIISYYESNKNDIKEKIGISKQEDFLKLIEYLNKVGYHGEKFVSCEIDSSTFDEGRKYFSFELTFNFENFSNNFKLKLNFANYTSTKPMVYYSVVEE